ncbi:hypothetical protein QQZ08_010675 [Neonectria magnoliae]|uniref:Uncharacterized protein n=1 Tax=Neonectria magnoliae TaxID=2732573 RepID=A0ABR1HFC2_9HYPO
MSRPVECIGMKVDAYILNTSVVGDTFFLAPTSQPQYGSLLPGQFNLRHDVEAPLDVRNASPWQQNSRIADIASKQVRKSRLGIYLHWCVPKVFRAGRTDAGGVQRSEDGSTSERQGSGTIEYESVPDRWLIFRHMAESQPSSPTAPALEIFLVESNKIRNVTYAMIGTGEDLETTSSPFLDPNLATEQQLRTVIGRVSRLTQDWQPGAGGVEKDAAKDGYYSPLTVLGTGNPRFADYMPHNAAVFSLHDDLTWEGRERGSTESAKVSYVVYGFSAKDAYELSSNAPTQQAAPVRVCWGCLYSVSYNRDAPPSVIKAADMAKSFANKQPLAIGDDVMDTCVAMLQGSGNAQESSMSKVFDKLKGAAALPESNSQLDRASTATNNFKGEHGGYRWRLAKKKEGSTLGSFEPSQTQDSSSIKPEQITVLRELNAVQEYLDALYRRKRYIRHLIFCEWWKHRSLFGTEEWLARQRRAQAKRQANLLLQRMKVVNTLLAAAEDQVKSIDKKSKPYGPFEKEEDDKFFSHTDPAFVIRDMGSGWPADWASNATSIKSKDFDSWLTTNATALKAWVDNIPFAKDAAPTTKAQIPDIWEQFINHEGLRRFPYELKESLKNVMIAFSRELVSDQPGNKPLVTNPSWNECCWNGQPWLPLFVEWEVEYVHIPSKLWELRHNDDGAVQYGLRDGKVLSNYQLGSRTFSGRTLLQPDAQKLIKGLLDMAYRTVPGAAGEDNKEKVWADEFLDGLSLLFGRLDGFTDHLLTLCQGAHVVPSAQHHPSRPGGRQSAEEILADEESFRLFYGSLPGDSNDLHESSSGLDVTPYGIRHEGLSYTASRNVGKPDDKDRFFRPVTHGQARLTQFKIADRFGQVICATDPRPDQAKKPLYPHIGSSLLCEPCTGGDGNEKDGPNTAQPLSPDEAVRGDCPWFQLGPRINQDARLHAAFLCDDAGSSRGRGQYRPVATGERAIFAWLLINFHNLSLQVYDKNCSFKGEAFLPSGPNQPVYWQSLMGNDETSDILPHMLPEEYHPRLKSRLKKMPISDAKGSKLPMSLEDLLTSMSYAPFLIQLWNAVLAAQDHMQPPPTEQFSQFPSALVGRPIALAHLGLGIELATAPMRSQTYADYAENFPAEDQGQDEAHDDPSETTGEEELTRYKFGVKLGDMLGHEDGLVGYWTPSKTKADGAAWTLVTDYTDRDDQSSSSSRHVQHPTNSPSLTVSPSYPRLLPSSTTAIESLNVSDEVAKYQSRKSEALHSSIVTVLIDPFLPIHVRSGILPAATAQLSRDIVERDLRELGVWLRSGPILIGARGSDPVSSEEGKMRIQVEGKTATGMRVPVHTPSTAATGSKWQWVQPVVDLPMLSTVDKIEPNRGLGRKVKYVHLGVTAPLKEGFDSAVGAEDEKTKSEEMEVAVALDGYLLLKS